MPLLLERLLGINCSASSYRSTNPTKSYNIFPFSYYYRQLQVPPTIIIVAVTAKTHVVRSPSMIVSGIPVKDSIPFGVKLEVIAFSDPCTTATAFVRIFLINLAGATMKILIQAVQLNIRKGEGVAILYLG
jgi:hypothetical protein